ncbi:MAG: alpha/beta fold hydrolase [Patescibacteria group bacterium]
MQKIFIKNRKDQNIAVIIEKVEKPKGLVFVMHGLGGFKEQLHVETFARVFRDNSYTVVRFDTTNSFGESDGDYADATVTNYYQDLEDVIDWAERQDFYQEPFVLCGHSLGGISTALYSQNYSEKIKALAPISTVVSGKISIERYSKEELEEWKKTGWQIKLSSDGKRVKKIKYNHIIDRLKYNLLDDADKLVMPVLLVAGELDESTPPKHQQLLFDKLPGQKELYIIKNAPHTFRDKDHLDEVYRIIDKWIKNI